jgi:ATP-independent RNA helicase DbpA
MTPSDSDQSATGFSGLGLTKALLRAVESVGYIDMTAIQRDSLPVMLTGRDLAGQAKTGSGKTAAFGLAALSRVDDSKSEPQVLVLVPTRELADQVAEELRKLSAFMSNTRVLTLCGGRPYRNQAKGLDGGAQVLVGTPGRIGKHLRKETLNLSTLRVLVLDEADRMLDMGFEEQVFDIVDQAPRKRQTLLFSATFPEGIERLSSEVQQDAELCKSEAQVEPSLLRQIRYDCIGGDRNQLIVNTLVAHKPSTALIFCETRGACDKLAGFLTRRGARALALHGLMEQRDRDDALVQFINGSATILVATNVAARGLDIPSLPLVIISEVGGEPESHLHRIGRTGRAGEAGLAVTLVGTRGEMERLRRIEEFMGNEIECAESPTVGGGLDFMTPKYRTLLVLSGRKDKVSKGDILGSLVKEGQIPAGEIGQIDLSANSCAVAVTRAFADQALNHLKHGRVKKRKVRAQLFG